MRINGSVCNPWVEKESKIYETRLHHPESICIATLFKHL